METESYFHNMIFFSFFFRISLKLSLHKTHRLIALSKIYMLDKLTRVAMVTRLKKREENKSNFLQEKCLLKNNLKPIFSLLFLGKMPNFYITYI